MLQMFSHAIVNKICTDVRKAGMYSIIVDGTQDISGKEQQSFCLHYVDEQLRPMEAFIGMYETPDTTGQTIANCVLDVLIRLQLPLSSLRGQTFDGASNMAGAYNFKVSGNYWPASAISSVHALWKSLYQSCSRESLFAGTTSAQFDAGCPRSWGSVFLVD